MQDKNYIVGGRVAILNAEILRFKVDFSQMRTDFKEVTLGEVERKHSRQMKQPVQKP